MAHHSAEVYSYYKKLAESSPYSSMQKVGTTEENRVVNMVMIGNEDALKQVDINIKNKHFC